VLLRARGDIIQPAQRPDVRLRPMRTSRFDFVQDAVGFPVGVVGGSFVTAATFKRLTGKPSWQRSRASENGVDRFEQLTR
jgi:hypothetical protein